VPSPLVPVRFRRNRGKWEVDCRKVPNWGAARPLFETEAQAQAYAAEVRKHAGRGSPPLEDREITLEVYAERWLARVEAEAGHIKKDLRYHLNAHLLPALGHLKLRAIRRAHVRTLWAEKLGEGYAKNTVRLMRATLSVILGDAVEDEILETNVALGTGRRGRKRPDRITEAERQEKVRPMTMAQRDALLALPGTFPYPALFHTLAKAGMRPGEALALKPEDLDFRAGTVRVERAVAHGRLKDTKTHTARTVDLTPGLVAILRRHLTVLSAEALKRGWGEPAWLFPNEASIVFDEGKVAKVFRRGLRRAKLPNFRLYDLRHTYASLLLAAGAPITYVANQLGHANPATTLRWYGRWVPGSGRRWVDVLDRVVPPQEPDSGTNVTDYEAGESEDLEIAGAGGGSRTRDLLITNQLLCH
jgi:integrase